MRYAHPAASPAPVTEPHFAAAKGPPRSAKASGFPPGGGGTRRPQDPLSDPFKMPPRRTPYGAMILQFLSAVALMVIQWFLQRRNLTNRQSFTLERPTGESLERVKGVDEVKGEFQSILQILKSRGRLPIEAQLPRGVLMEGPSGTGKTMLARALASEAGVSFIKASGPQLGNEVLAGSGAAKIRALFQFANKNAPCIVFIDEIDALGRDRSMNIMADNGPINEFLDQMDGFNKNPNVLVVAATNRAEILDPAFEKRFEKKIHVPLPFLPKQREEILKVHLAGKPLAADVNVSYLAELTERFSGRELADLVKESVHVANQRLGREMEASRTAGVQAVAGEPLADGGLKPTALEITQADMLEAFQRVQLGLPKPLELTTAEERERVAVHELGHAWLCYLLKEPINIISTEPRNQTLGVVFHGGFKPMADNKQDFLKSVLISLAGRAIQERFQGKNVGKDPGARSDLAKMTATLRAMVLEWGMFPEVTMTVEKDSAKTTHLSGEKYHQIEKLVDKVAENAYDAVTYAVNQLDEADFKRIRAELAQKPVVHGRENTRQLFERALQKTNVASIQKVLHQFLEDPTERPAKPLAVPDAWQDFWRNFWPWKEPATPAS